MKVNLLADYRGVLTDERFYPAGVHDLPSDQAEALVNAGRAELKYEEYDIAGILPMLKTSPTVPARRASRKRTAKKK